METREHSNVQWSVAAKVSLAIAIVGALNWGLIGFFNFDLVAAIFGDGSAATRVVYALVGLAGLAAIFLTPWGARRRAEGMQVRRRTTA